MTMLDSAQTLASNGWHVFPVTPQDKLPLIAEWPANASTDEAQINKWWGLWPLANIGVVTGERSGIFVLDVDGEEGEVSLEALERRNGELPQTAVAHTGKGRHFYFKHVPGVRNTARKLGYGLDTRGEGGFVLAPPSVHPNGKVYEWTPGNGSVAEAPQWLVDLILEIPEGPSMDRDPATIATDGSMIEHGQRNATLASLAGTMRRRHMEPAEIEAALLAVNANRCDPPLSAVDVQKIARSVGRYATQPEDAPRARKVLVHHVDVVTRDYIEFARNPQGRQRLGFESLDARLRGGLAPGELGVLAAAPYSGKTTLLANVAVNNPTSPMLFVSIEMTLILVAARLFSMLAGEEYRTLEERLKHGNKRLIERVLRETGDGLSMLGLVGVGGPNAATLRRAVADYRDEFQTDPKLMMIDYLDLMSPPSMGVEAVKQKLVDLRQLAKEESLAVLVAHQLKREAYDINPGQPLGFTDTRYGGETEADHLLGLYRRILDPDVQARPLMLEQHRHTVNYQILKTRSDETVQAVTHELDWNPDTLRITEPNGSTPQRWAAARVFTEEALWNE